MQGVCQFYYQRRKSRFFGVEALGRGPATLFSAPLCTSVQRDAPLAHHAVFPLLARQELQGGLTVGFDVGVAQVLWLILASYVGGRLIAIVGIERHAALAYGDAT